MKTQISRWSDDPAKRRSGIYQQQGRMISDADLNELVELLKRRVDDALGDVVGSGTPRSGGVGLVSPGTTPSVGPLLRPGALYADGVRARLVPSASGATTFALSAQADFPSPPIWPASGEQILYADIWELTTSALQDTTQLDPGLHGADTSTRTQMLAQVKWCPSATDPLSAPQNPRKGDATLAVELSEGQAEADPCDPCAAEIALDGRVGNYLFRAEVHDVQGPANAPTEITLKWSSENGAEQHAQADVPAEYKRGDWIYEFYNDTTERLLGVHLVGTFSPARALLKDGWPAAEDLPAPAQYPYVRRWDGYAVLVRSGTVWSVKSVSSTLQAKDRGRLFAPLPSGATPTHGHFTIGATLVAYLSGLKLTLALNTKKFVAGDFWLATVREDAEGAARVQQTQTTPIGIDHHYVALARATGATVVPFSDADTRRLSFPRLTDLTADHVGYDPVPKSARWTDIIDDGAVPAPVNLQSAIDTLVDKLESSDISYTLPTCPPSNTNTLRQLLLSTLPASQKINDLLDKLLCGIDSSNVPYTVTSAAGTTVKSMIDAINTTLPTKVNKAGDTMTGALIVNPAPAVTTSVDVIGTLRTEQFNLIAPTGTPNKAVLTYELATGLAKWLETSLTAWELASGNLRTEPTVVTGGVTINAPGGLFLPHATPTTVNSHSVEIGNSAAAVAGVANGRIGFPGNGVRHGQLRWVPGVGAAGRFEFVDSSAASPSGDYGATPTLISMRALNGSFTGSVDVVGKIGAGVGATAPVMSVQANTPSLWSSPAIGGINGPTRWAYLHVSTVDHSVIWNNTVDMRFGVESGQGSGYTELMRISRFGRVGIGNNNPQVALEVAGQINAGGAVFFNRQLMLASASNTVTNPGAILTLASPSATVSIPHVTPLRITLDLTRVDLSGTNPTVTFSALLGTGAVVPLGTLTTGLGGGTLNNKSLHGEIDFPAGATTVQLQWQVNGAFGASSTLFLARTLRIDIM